MHPHPLRVPRRLHNGRVEANVFRDVVLLVIGFQRRNRAGDAVAQPFDQVRRNLHDACGKHLQALAQLIQVGNFFCRKVV